MQIYYIYRNNYKSGNHRISRKITCMQSLHNKSDCQTSKITEKEAPYIPTEGIELRKRYWEKTLIRVKITNSKCQS